MSADTVTGSNWERLASWFRSGIGKPSVKHVAVVIVLEFFAWGLLTNPMITALNETFPNHTFLINSLILGIKGLLTIVGAPVIGVLSDKWGRKLFLILSVFFTCAPISLIQFNTLWYFAALSISGIFAVTFSLVFAYVVDITSEKERVLMFGRISATFAVTLMISSALGAYIEMVYGTEAVVKVAIIIAVLDILFILFVVPESLPNKLEMSPCTAFRKMTKDKAILLLHNTILLSYLPEVGQFSCLFIYLRMVLGFEPEKVAKFITLVGIKSVVAQTIGIKLLNKWLELKRITLVGLFFLMAQLALFGFCTETWIIWVAGILLAWSSITYPAICALVSIHADPDKQGLAQGLVMGVRGLCNALGPFIFMVIFHAFQFDFENGDETKFLNQSVEFPNRTISTHPRQKSQLLADIMPGPPFAFGSFMVLQAIIVFLFVPSNNSIRRQEYINETELENQSNPRQNPSTIEPIFTQNPDVIT